MSSYIGFNSNTIPEVGDYISVDITTTKGKETITGIVQSQNAGKIVMVDGHGKNPYEIEMTTVLNWRLH